MLIKITLLAKNSSDPEKSNSVLHAGKTAAETSSPGYGNTHRSYIWAFTRRLFKNSKTVIFEFCQSRSGEDARYFLGTGKRSLITDDFSGYKAIHSILKKYFSFYIN